MDIKRYRSILESKGLKVDNIINDAFLVRNKYGKANWVKTYKVALDMIPEYVFTDGQPISKEGVNFKSEVKTLYRICSKADDGEYYKGIIVPFLFN